MPSDVVQTVKVAHAVLVAVQELQPALAGALEVAEVVVGIHLPGSERDRVPVGAAGGHAGDRSGEALPPGSTGRTDLGHRVDPGGHAEAVVPVHIGRRVQVHDIAAAIRAGQVDDKARQAHFVVRVAGDVVQAVEVAHAVRVEVQELQPALAGALEVAEVVVGIHLPGSERDRVPVGAAGGHAGERSGEALPPGSTGRTDLGHRVDPGGHAEAVVPVDIGRRVQVHGIAAAIRAGQVDDKAGQAHFVVRVAGDVVQAVEVAHAVRVDVQELQPALAGVLEVAEVHVSDVFPAGERDISRIVCALRVAGRQALTDAVRSWGEVQKDVVAVGVRRGTRLARIEDVVSVGIEEDGQAGQPQLPGLLGPVAVEVVELQAGDAAGPGSATANGDHVGIQGHGTNSRQGSTGHNCCTSTQGDALVRENIPCERSGRSDSRGAADLPEHVAAVSAIDHGNRRVACRRERAPDLENELRIGVALSVESQHSRQLGRRRKSIDTRYERKSTQILSSQVEVGRSAREIVVRSGGIHLRLLRDRIRLMHRPVERDAP